MAEIPEEVVIDTSASSLLGVLESQVTTSNYGQGNTVSNAKFEVEKFDGIDNFNMWLYEVLAILYQQEFDIMLEKRPDDISLKQGLDKV